MERLRARFRRLERYVDAAIESWVGYSRRPPVRVMRECAWRPDAPADYCPRCGGSVGPGEVDDRPGCPGCAGRRLGRVATVRLGPYQGDLREWILALKFRGWTEMGLELGRHLGRALRERELAVERSLIVPLPMSRVRRLHRGIDHARTIADGVGESLHVPVVPLLRRANGPGQAAVARSTRRRHGGRGLSVANWPGGFLVSGCTVVLVDDVMTTGGTLVAAARRLQRLRPDRIIAAVAAVTPPPSRQDSAPFHARPDGCPITPGPGTESE